MHVRKYLVLAFCASVFVFIGQAMAGEWTDEFEDEDQMAEDWTPLFGTWKFMDDKEIVRYTFPQGLPNGKIGLGGEQSNSEYEYITIVGPRIGFEALEAAGKLATTWAALKL